VRAARHAGEQQVVACSITERRSLDDGRRHDRSGRAIPHAIDRVQEREVLGRASLGLLPGDVRLEAAARLVCGRRRRRLRDLRVHPAEERRVRRASQTTVDRRDVGAAHEDARPGRRQL